MGTVADKLNYLKETKTAIKNALVGKGVEVADSDTFRSYAQKVADIPVGGGDIDALIDRSITEISSSVTSIGIRAFSSCKKLVSANFPNATSIEESGFGSCSALTSVSFPVVTSISDFAFFTCSALTSVSFPVTTSIGKRSFYNCSALTSVSFPVITSIESEAFSFCSALTTMYIGIESGTVCTLLSTDALNQCVRLTDIYVPEMLVDSYKAAANWSDFADKIKAYTGEIV